jgi:CHAT domain-containing protein/Tfp pilus assembly protein PilF
LCTFSAVLRLRGLETICCLALCIANGDVQGGAAGETPRNQTSETRAQSIPEEFPVRRLTTGERVEREITGGITHRYEVSLKAGQLAVLLVDQHATDLTLTVFGVAGTLIAEFDGRWHGPEPVFVRSSADGVYRIEVRTVLKPTVPESYQLVLDSIREVVPDDATRLNAATLASESKKLVTQGTAAALQTALKNYEELLPVWRALEDRYGEAATLNTLGFAAVALGRFEESLTSYRSSLRLWRELGYTRGEAETLLNIAAAYSFLGEKREALSRYEEVLALNRRLQDRRGEMYVLNNIGTVLSDLGEPRSALERFSRVLELAKQTGDQLMIAAAFANMSAAHHVLGEFQQALEFSERAVSSAPASNLRGRSAMFTALGNVLFRLGENDRARDAFQQAIALAKSAGDPRTQAAPTLQLASLHLDLGELDEAFVQLREAEALAGAVKDRRSLAWSLARRGELHHRRHETNEALTSFGQAIALLQEVGDPRNEALAHHGVGLVKAAIGDTSGARESLNRALARAHVVEDRYIESQVLVSLARLDRDAGELDQARSHAEAALTIIDAIRGDVINQQFRTSYASSTHECYELAIDVLMRLHTRDPASGFDRMALEVSERGRARSLLDLLKEARADIRQGVDPSLLGRERELRERVNAKAERLAALTVNKQTERAAKALEGELEEAVARLRDTETEIRTRSPQFAALTLPQPLRAAEIQAQVDSETVLLVYSLGETRSYVWIVRPTRIESLELPGRDDIEKAARQIHMLVTARADRPAGETVSQWRRRLANADADHARASAALSDMIVRPAFPRLDAKRVVVVSEGALQYVPFGALPIPGFPDGRPLLTAYEVATAPSVSSLNELRRAAAVRQTPSRTLAVLADPVFTADDPRVVRAATPSRSSSSAADSAPLSVRDVERASEDVRGISTNHLARLPFSRREADEILRYVQRAESVRAVDFEASYATATSPDLGRYRFVHFATHGLLDSTHPELSGLVFSLVDRKGRPQRGFLRAHEVYNLRLPADLVVLSGCRTGLGKDVKGEGMVGLVRGFMYAGAQRVALSLWQVDDEATAELMSRFYTAMLRDGLAPTAALRSAQLGLRSTRRWSAPFYWAGFVLQGEWR